MGNSITLEFDTITLLAFAMHMFLKQKQKTACR